MEMSFLGSIGHIMSKIGLKDLFSVVYADNTVPHMLSEKQGCHGQGKSSGK